MSSLLHTSPLQTVIIPTYNRKIMLAEAIISVLKQTQASLEIIVVDDCSNDGTEEYVKSIPDERVKYIRNKKNSGQEYSRMIGLRHAQGRYITFLDDDDYYIDYEFFSKAVKIFRENDNEAAPIAMVYANAECLNVKTGYRTTDDIGNPGRVRSIDYILELGYKKPPSTFPAVFKTQVLRDAGLEDMIIFDTETYFEAALEGDGWLMPGVIGVYRIHEDGDTRGYKNHTLHEARKYNIVLEMFKRLTLIRDKLCGLLDSKTVSRWYVVKITDLIRHATAKDLDIKNMINVICIISASGFRPKVKLWMSFIIAEIRRQLRKIKSLRKVYRFFRYKCLGQPYPSGHI